MEEVLSRSVLKVWEVMRGRSEGGCLKSERVWSAGVQTPGVLSGESLKYTGF